MCVCVCVCVCVCPFQLGLTMTVKKAGFTEEPALTWGNVVVYGLEKHMFDHLEVNSENMEGKGKYHEKTKVKKERKKTKLL